VGAGCHRRIWTFAIKVGEQTDLVVVSDWFAV
jgi:hypothetical protein